MPIGILAGDSDAMILSSADILRILGGNEVIRLSAKLSITDGKPSLSGREGTYIHIERFPIAQEFEATWSIYIESDEEIDLVIAEIKRLLPKVQVEQGLLTVVKTTDFRSESTQTAPEAPKAKTAQVDLAQYEERFQSLVEDVQDQMLLVTSGRPGKDGRDGKDGADGRDGKDIDATETKLFDLQDVDQSVLAMEKGQVLTWDGSKWTNLYVRQVMSAGGAAGGSSVNDPDDGLGGVVSSFWKFDEREDEAYSDGKFRVNSHQGKTDWSLTTEVYLGYKNNAGNIVKNYILQLVKPGQYLYIQKSDNPDAYAVFEVASSPVDADVKGARIGVTFVTQGPEISEIRKDKTCGLTFTLITGEGGGGGVEEAPTDGQQYGRQDGAWSVISSGGGAVDSVNGQTGVVELDIEDLENVSLVATAGDPDFSSTPLLLRFDGPQGGTTFTNDGNTSLGTPVVTGAITDQTEVKFGTASGKFTGPDCIHFPHNNAFHLGTGDFTIETWLYTVGVGDTQSIISFGDNQTGSVNKGWSVFYTGSGFIGFYGTSDGSDSQNKFFPWAATNNTWYHVAVVRESGVLRAFVDGVQVGADEPYTVDLYPTTVGGLRLGCYASGGFGFDGWLDETRVTVGIARYTSDFTAPTAAFPGAPSFAQPTDGQVLTWVDANSQWQPVTPSGGSGGGATTLAELTDTNVTGAAEGDVLTYQSGIWTTTADPSALSLQPGDNVSELVNDAGYITAGDIPADAVTSVAGKTGDVTLVKADITDFSDADYATAAQGALADSALQTGSNISELNNDAGYITEIAGNQFSSTFRYSSNTGLSPGAGYVQFDSTNYSNVTKIAFSKLDRNNNDTSEFLNDIVKPGFTVYFEQQGVATRSVQFEITGLPDDNIGNVTWNATLISQTGLALQDNNDVITQFQSAPISPVTSVAGKTGAVTLVKADLLDFSDADYATAAQGDLADTSVQPGDNVSTLNNDAGYITSAEAGVSIDDVRLDAENTTFTYTSGNLTSTTGSEVQKTFTYDVDDVLQSVTITSNGTSVTKTFGYDVDGNLTSITVT